jgi:hypothetical protein
VNTTVEMDKRSSINVFFLAELDVDIEGVTPSLSPRTPATPIFQFRGVQMLHKSVF